MNYQEKAETISLLLKQINKRIHNQFHELIDSYGLTVPQMFVLRALVKEGNLPISELSKRLGLTSSTISGIVDRLEKEGYVERRRAEEDRRVVYVSLTKKSCDLKNTVPALLPDYFSSTLQDLGPEKVDQIIESLTILANH